VFAAIVTKLRLLCLCSEVPTIFFMKATPFLLLGFLIIGVSAAFGGVPSVKVTISDASGNLAYQG
jgi:hypothetical protein